MFTYFLNSTIIILNILHDINKLFQVFSINQISPMKCKLDFNWTLNENFTCNLHVILTLKKSHMRSIELINLTLNLYIIAQNKVNNNKCNITTKHKHNLHSLKTKILILIN